MTLHSNFKKTGKEFVDFFKVSVVDNKNNEFSENRLKSACTPAFLCHKFARFGLFSWPFSACSPIVYFLFCLLFFFCFFFLWAQFPFQRTISNNNRWTVGSRVRPDRSKPPFPLHRSPLSYVKTPIFPNLWNSIPNLSTILLNCH